MSGEENSIFFRCFSYREDASVDGIDDVFLFYTSIVRSLRTYAGNAFMRHYSRLTQKCGAREIKLFLLCLFRKYLLSGKLQADCKKGFLILSDGGTQGLSAAQKSRLC